MWQRKRETLEKSDRRSLEIEDREEGTIELQEEKTRAPQHGPGYKIKLQGLEKFQINFSSFDAPASAVCPTPAVLGRSLCERRSEIQELKFT